MLGIQEINARLARLGRRIEFRRHGAGSGLFYKVALDWRGEGRGFVDGVKILNSAMNLQWVNDDAAMMARDIYRRAFDGPLWIKGRD